MTAPVIVAIDGPSGVGKTTTSRRVASRLGLPHIDTGAMYRAVALKAIRECIALDDEAGLERLASSCLIEFSMVDGVDRIRLDGRDVTDPIREPDISMAASRISALPAVRRVLVKLQQAIGRLRGGVLEGRDIGTKVFPETPHKFFLTARPEVRSERRHRDLVARGGGASLDEVRLDMEKRDGQDSTRADSPLTCDESYKRIDTSEMTLDEVVDAIVIAVASTA